MDGFGVSSALFCEQCGLDRDQLGDESIAPFRECPSCARAICPNCWNLVRGSCLRCAPFSLAATAAPRVIPLTPTSPDRRPGPATARCGQGGEGSEAPPPREGTEGCGRPPRWPPLRRRRSARSRGRSAPAPPSSTRRGRRRAAPPSRSGPPFGRPASPTRRRKRPSGFAPVAGMVVVLVALFGVAGFALAAFGRLPAAGGATPPARTQGPTQPDASSAGSAPSVAFPTGEAPTDPTGPAATGASDTTGATGDPGAPGAHGAPGSTVRPDGSTPKPTAHPGSDGDRDGRRRPRPRRPIRRRRRLPIPRRRPTPDPTPTPTPDPTPTADPDPRGRRRPTRRRRPTPDRGTASSLAGSATTIERWLPPPVLEIVAADAGALRRPRGPVRGGRRPEVVLVHLLPRPRSRLVELDRRVEPRRARVAGAATTRRPGLLAYDGDGSSAG